MASGVIAHVNLSRGYGSVERQTELLIKGLAQGGTLQILVCRDDSPLIRRLKGLRNLKIQVIHGVVDPKYLGHLRLGKRAAVIHAHDSHGARWALIHYLFFATPYVLTVRSLRYLDFRFGTKIMIKWASVVVAITSKISSRIEEYYGVEATVIQNCCSNIPPLQRNVDKIKDAFKNRFVVGHIGPLVNRRKGQTELINAAKALKDKIPDLIVIFIGGGDDLALLKEKSKDMPNVKFLGTVRNTIDYICCMDVFVYTNRDDDAGDAILDVINMHVPIVATDYGHLPDYIRHEVTSLVVKPNNPKAMADAIMRIKTDYNLRDHLKVCEQNESVRHSSELMTTNYIAMYSRAANG